MYNDLIPEDATISSYNPDRFSVITGLVYDIDELPLPDVSVTVHGHPEYGTSLTDAEGRFSLPVEGGAVLTMVYRKPDYITSHRQVETTWNDIAITDTVILLQEDSAVTTVSFDGNSDTIITHTSTPVSDTFGTRSTTLIFGGDNQAFLVDEQGNDITELASFDVRATEYIVPESMPAVLPPTSAYTYCAELKADGAERIRFAKPVVMWVDNFLGFEVGSGEEEESIVPVGYYDRDRAVWVPSDNGIVVRLLDTDGDGVVDGLDVDDDGFADDLDEDSLVADEVAGLDDPSRFPPGSTFWRAEIQHFTPWDHNWPFGPPDGSQKPDNQAPDPNFEDPCDDCSENLNSYVNMKTKEFHEDIPLPGTGLTLHYSSKRTEGYKYERSIPVSGETVPEPLEAIIAELRVAGRYYQQRINKEDVASLANQRVDFNWDGKDRWERPVESRVTGQARIGYVYKAVYRQPGREFAQAFAQAGTEVTGIRGRQETISWQRFNVNFEPEIDRNYNNASAQQTQFGNGWTLSNHHSLIQSDLLVKGDGTTRKYGPLSSFIINLNLIKNIAGTGESGYSGDNGPALEAELDSPNGLAVDGAGNIYFAEPYNYAVRKVDINGAINTVAGGIPYDFNPCDGFCDECCVGDNGPAIDAGLKRPTDVAVDRAGNLYIADYQDRVVRKVNTDGIITTVVGGGDGEYEGSPNGRSALDITLEHPVSVTTDAFGNLYVAEDDNNRVLKVNPNGIVSVVAGNGVPAGPDEVDQNLDSPSGITTDAAGNLYIADTDNNRVRKVDTSGLITTVAGDGSTTYIDGKPALETGIYYPQDVAVDMTGNLFILAGVNGAQKIFRVNTEGIVNIIAANNEQQDTIPVNGMALDASIHPNGIAVDPIGNLLITNNYPDKILKIMPAPLAEKLESTVTRIVVPDQNDTMYLFTEAGKHVETVDRLTGTTLNTFQYGDDNNLTSITDRFNKSILIEPTANGAAIISPYGHRTELVMNALGDLTDIEFEDGTGYTFGYKGDTGLMETLRNPRQLTSYHDFNGTGRVLSTEDPEQGIWTLRHAILNSVSTEFSMTSSVDDNTTRQIHQRYGNGTTYSTTITPDGTERKFIQENQGLYETNEVCGMTTATEYTLDAQSKQKIPKSVTITTKPGNRTNQIILEKAYTRDLLNTTILTASQKVTHNGKPSETVTDYQANTITRTTPEGRVSTAIFDPATLLITDSGIIAGEDNQLLPTHYDYYPDGRLWKVSTGDRFVSYTYDSRGNLETVTDAKNRVTEFIEYDLLGRLKKVKRPDANASVVEFDYDEAGNMSLLVSPNPQQDPNHVFHYNGVNKRSEYITPLNSVTEYKYDKERKLTDIILPSTKTITNVYEKSRLKEVITPDWKNVYAYDCGTRLSSIKRKINDVVQETISYDQYDGSLLMAESRSGVLNQTLNYDYNVDFALSSFTYAGAEETYLYDNDGLLTNTSRFTLTRNPANGLPESVSDSSFTWGRDFSEYGELDDLTVDRVGTALFGYNLFRNTVGRITEKTETVNGIAVDYVYTYDNLDRLRTVTKAGVLVEEYRYDDNDNRTYELNTARNITGRSFAHSVEDHIITAGSITYSFDLDDQLSARTDGTEETLYAYSATGELQNVTLPDGTFLEYVHDPLGRRVAKKVDGTLVEKYLWSGRTTLLAVYDGSDNLLQRFEYADDRVPYVMTAGGSTYYLLYDQVGSLRLITDSNGAIIKEIVYDSFGNILSETNPSFTIPFGFAGGLHDRDTGLVRFGFRDYMPEIGRWTAKDPILFAGGDTNLYGYVLNDPVNFIDPDGLVRKNTVEAKIAEAATKGDIAQLEGLAQATGNPAAKAAIKRLNTKAIDLIKGQLRRSKSYCSELEEKSMAELIQLAKGKGDTANRADKMLKLIKDSKRLLDKLGAH
jgi:RHS repeat-associated protein